MHLSVTVNPVVSRGHLVEIPPLSQKGSWASQSPQQFLLFPAVTHVFPSHPATSAQQHVASHAKLVVSDSEHILAL